MTAALAYAAAGWYVLPVATGKHPGSVVGAGWPAKSSRDPKQIAAWFAGANCGIALHCGRSGAVAFDVDDATKVPDVLAKHLGGAPYQSSRPDAPGRGHYLFSMPPGRMLGNGTGGLGGGWGEVRGANGVVVVAPSAHAAGGEYRWQRVGPVAVLPAELADQLGDATSADAAASDATVAAFLAEHAAAARAGLLAGLTKALAAKFAAGESRHHSTVAALTGALKEARAGMYRADEAAARIRAMFLDAVAAPPVSSKQGQPRVGAVAEYEWRGILAWAVAQALAADLGEVRARATEKLPDDHAWMNAATVPVAAVNGSPPPVVGVADGGAPFEPAPPTSWERFDLGPWLAGEVQRPEPSIGIARGDGLQLLYPGREHAVLGETESGKTWFALECVAAELRSGRDVLYVHYEESDPASTVERLGLLGVAPAVVAERLRFVAPVQPLRDARWLAALLDPPPPLIVHDGVNEAMALHGYDIMTAEGAARFRRCLVAPCTRVGAAVLACDHLPKVRDGASRDAYGSVHKGNGLDGARFVLENVKPFGRGMRGVSNLYLTKDRPGVLRARGRPSKIAGKTYLGSLVVDDASAPFEPLSLTLSAPEDGDEPVRQDGQVAEAVYAVVAAEPDRTVPSRAQLYARMRAAGHAHRDAAVRVAADDLVVAGRLTEVPGKAGATGYRATLATTSARDGER